MRYLNEVNPNVKILIQRGPDLPKGANQNVRQDRFVEFRFGMAETDDPDAIAALDARLDCTREEDKGKIKGYVSDADIEAEVQRRIDAAMANLPKPSDSRDVQGRGSHSCPKCGKSVSSQLALSGHMRSHKKEAVAVG